MRGEITKKVSSSKDSLKNEILIVGIMIFDTVSFVSIMEVKEKLIL